MGARRLAGTAQKYAIGKTGRNTCFVNFSCICLAVMCLEGYIRANANQVKHE